MAAAKRKEGTSTGRREHRCLMSVVLGILDVDGEWEPRYRSDLDP